MCSRESILESIENYCIGRLVLKKNSLIRKTLKEEIAYKRKFIGEDGLQENMAYRR
jgi:hypothetical protein